MPISRDTTTSRDAPATTTSSRGDHPGAERGDDEPRRGHLVHLLLGGDRAAAPGRRAPPRHRRPVGRSCRPAASASSSARRTFASASRRNASDTAEPDAARHLEPELREPDDPGEQRLHDVDGLQPVEPRLALLPEQDAGVQVDGLVSDREPRHPPRDRGVAEADERDDARPPTTIAPGAVPPGSRPPAEVVADLAPPMASDRDEDLPALERGRDRVHAPPAGDVRVAAGARRRGALAHRPASRASPRDASRSRRRAASCGGRPSIVAFVAGRRGVQLHRRDAEPPRERPGGDVDVLHAPVRHDHQRPEHDAAPHQQVVGPLGVGHRPHLSRAPAPRSTARAAATDAGNTHSHASPANTASSTTRSAAARRPSRVAVSRAATRRGETGVQVTSAGSNGSRVPGRRRRSCTHPSTRARAPSGSGAGRSRRGVGAASSGGGTLQNHSTTSPTTASTSEHRPPRRRQQRPARRCARCRGRRPRRASARRTSRSAARPCSRTPSRASPSAPRGSGRASAACRAGTAGRPSPSRARLPR